MLRPARPGTAHSPPQPACCRASDWQGAIKRYTASIELFPTAEAYGNRAAALMQQGRWQEAAADCSQALGQTPYFVKAYIRRSRCHTQLGNHAGALQVPAPPAVCMCLLSPKQSGCFPNSHHAPQLAQQTTA
jgi:tetratricopeptide (TPR) repeat protein